MDTSAILLAILGLRALYFALAAIPLRATLGLFAGGVRASLWKTRGQPALAAST